MSREALLNEIKSAKSIVVAAHISPDTDAVGSSFGLVRALRSIGKDARAYLYDDISNRVRPLIGDTPWSREVPTSEIDLFISIDTATKARLGLKNEELFKCAKRSAVIDHHVSNIGYGDVNYIVGDAPSSASLVLEIANVLNATLDETSLNLLYAGLCDDTGSFRYSNSSVRAFNEAGELVKRGVNPERIAEILFFSTPLRLLKLRSKALDTLELVLDGQLGIASVSQQLLDELGCKSEDTEGLIDDIRAVEGTVGAVFLRQLADGWKASIRSKSDSFDANAVAGKFGGGGHRAAAGCTIREPLERVKELMVDAIKEALSF